MQKKSRVSEQFVAWGYFSTDFAFVLVRHSGRSPVNFQGGGWVAPEATTHIFTGSILEEEEL